MKTISLDMTYSDVSEGAISGIKEKALLAHKTLFEKTGLGNDFLGWLDYHENLTDSFISDIQSVAEKIRKDADAFLVLGIGGSYIGAKSFIDALSPVFKNSDSKPDIYFLGQHIDGSYIKELLTSLKGKSVYVNVISKSGTTTETAIAFRVVRAFLREEYGEDYYDRIVGTTDANRGVLREYCDKRGIKTYVIPDDIGGRYSVFTPVGLLAIAVAGFDITEIAKAYSDSINFFKTETTFENTALKYAALRNMFYNDGLKIEILINYLSKLNPLSEWWKQLFGESEGKEKHGIFPASMSFTTDLHSLGQYIQDGPRLLFETVLSIEEESSEQIIPLEDEDEDKLKYLEGKKYSEINRVAMDATLMAHNDGGVPCLVLKVPKLNEYNLAHLYVFFMISCAISAYMLGVNPFNQPGVEFYKKNMFKILGKPGY